MDSKNHGFYIHGNNPVGSSEQTIDKIKLNLIRE